MDVSRMPKEGDRFGNWTITRILNKGGMGMVYLVRNSTLRVERALKVLDPAIAERNHEFVDRFNQEAALVCGMHSPHLVEVYDAGCEGASGFYYIVMEYLGGGTLRDRMRCRGRIPWREALGIVRQVALALAAVEKRHSVHRDIKPENILFTSDGVAKLVDFGIAKAVQDDAENMLKTLPAQVFGTPAYMSPEQVKDASTVDARADIWSLGIVLFEMLAGDRPYPATNIVEVTSFLLSPNPLPDIRTFKAGHASAEQRTAATLPTMETQTFCAEGKRDVPGETGGGSPPEQRELDVPEGVVSLLARMCEKSLEKRLSSGDEIVAAIDEILETSSQPETAMRTVAQTVPPVEDDKGKAVRGSGRPDDSRRRRTLRVACAGMLLLVVATGAAILLKPHLRLPITRRTVAAVGPAEGKAPVETLLATNSVPASGNVVSSPSNVVSCSSNVAHSTHVAPMSSKAVFAPGNAVAVSHSTLTPVATNDTKVEIAMTPSLPKPPLAQPPVQNVFLFQPQKGSPEQILSRLDRVLGERPKHLKVSLSACAKRNDWSVERYEHQVLVPVVERLRGAGVGFSLVPGPGKYGVVVLEVAKRFGCDLN